MAGQLAGQPVIILDPNKTRTQGRDAQRMNIQAAKVIANSVRTTLGPKGMDKMLVNAVGDSVVTNDGATILKEMDIQHPAAKMIAEVARTQEDEAGDGTTSAVVIAGKLLENAEELLDKKVHPTVIANGYQLAAQKAIEALNDISVTIDKNDREMLLKIAMTALSGKGSELALDPLAKVCVDAILSLSRKGNIKVDEHVNILQQRGGATRDTVMTEGMVIDYTRAHKNMPKRVEKAKIALLDTGIEVQKTSTQSKMKLTSAGMLREAWEVEHTMVREDVDAIAKSGANVIITEKGIDDISLHYLSKKKLFAVRRVKEEIMKKLAHATGARIVSNVHDIDESDLGTAELVEERGIGNYRMIHIEGCPNPKAVSIIVHSGADQVTEEVKRALDDGLRAVNDAVTDGRVVAGGGAPEVEVAMRLHDYASGLEGREQLAVHAFADALESIPRSLAENAGLDAINMTVALRSRHNAGDVTAGLDVYKGEPVDMLARGVIEPLRVKVQAIKSATDAANMILRVDDVFAAKETGMLDVKPEHRADYYDGISPPDVEKD